MFEGWVLGSSALCSSVVDSGHVSDAEGQGCLITKRASMMIMIEMHDV